MLLASVTGHVTSFVGDHGLTAVFVLMFLAAIVPAASELVMLYAGAVAAGAFAHAHISLFGDRISTPFWAYLAIAVTALVANVLGALAGWAIGIFGGRPLVLRHGRWIHVSSQKLERTEDRLERAGASAVAFGFALPVVRSFVAIPSGIVGLPFAKFLTAAIAGCALFCFAFAGVGWAVGTSYDSVHGDLRYVDFAVLAGTAALVAYLVFRRRSTRLASRADRPAR